MELGRGGGGEEEGVWGSRRSVLINLYPLENTSTKILQIIEEKKRKYRLLYLKAKTERACLNSFIS